MRRWTTNAFVVLIPRARPAIDIAGCDTFVLVSEVFSDRKKWREINVADRIKF
jgi:hypothetical protein